MCEGLFKIIFPPNFLGFLKFVEMQGRRKVFFFVFFLLFFQEQGVGTDHFLVVFLSSVIVLWDVFNVCLCRGFPTAAFRILRENNQAPCCAE